MDAHNGMGGTWTGSMPSCTGMKTSSNLHSLYVISKKYSNNYVHSVLCAHFQCDAAICDSLTLDHGVISYSSSTTPRLEGTVATHSCDEGYGLSPSVRARTCQPDRTWSGENITCHGKIHIIFLAAILYTFYFHTCSYHMSTSHSSLRLGKHYWFWTTLSLWNTSTILGDILS